MSRSTSITRKFVHLRRRALICHATKQTSIAPRQLAFGQARRLPFRTSRLLIEEMLVSGSLAKGTALRSLNDIDVACYISGAEAPTK